MAPAHSDGPTAASGPDPAPDPAPPSVSVPPSLPAAHADCIHLPRHVSSAAKHTHKMMCHEVPWDLVWSSMNKHQHEVM